MDYYPNYLLDGMQEHTSQAPAALSLPYLAMEEIMQPCTYIPQAIPTSYSQVPFLCNEETRLASVQGADSLPRMDNLESLNPMYADPTIACTYPSFPSWVSGAETSFISAAPCPIPFEQGQYLLHLQALLRAEYGISVTLEELLAFDGALPALLHTENDPHLPAAADMGVKLEEQHDLQASHGLLNTVDSFQAVQLSQGATTSVLCVSPIHNKVLCVSDTHRPQDISSPGSAASSSVVTDSDTSDKSLSAERLAAPIANIPSPLASVNSQSWISPSISWLQGADHGVLQAFKETPAAMEIIEPPAQRRRKLQGFTIEQVLQAEKMQSVNASSLPLQAPSNPFLGRDVLASVENGVRRGSYDVTLGGNGEQDLSRRPIPIPIPQPRKPAPTSVEPQSIAARHRRKRIRERTESLGMIIPGATRLDTAAMFDLAIKYVHFLQAQMFCLENEVSLRQQRLSYEDENAAGFRRALIHRLLSSQDVQNFLSREGLCLVTEGLAKRLNFDPSSVLAVKGPSPAYHPPLPLASDRGRTI